MSRGAVKIILFDLDETLILEKPVALRALEQTGQRANAEAGVRPAELRDRVLERAGELWRSTPAIDYCRRVGISSWEGLWCEFAGENENLVWLHEWSPTYRFESWSRALNDMGVDDKRLARSLADDFVEIRSDLFEHFPETIEILNELKGAVRLVLATNGASDLQRLKLETSGLAGYFDDVLVSGDVGFAKPHPRFFENALRLAHAGPEQTLMVGDNLRKDIGGAQEAGIRGIWVNRKDREPVEVQPFAEIKNLLDLRDFI